MNGYLNRKVVWKAFWVKFWRTIAYPLPVMTLAEDQGECITKELYRKLLPAMGVNQNLPWAYCHVSKMFQGMGISEITVYQTIATVSYCMIHGTSDTLTGESMRALVEQVQTEIGMGTAFVKIPLEKFSTCTTETWLNTMWENLGGVEIELLWHELPFLPMQRKIDT